MNNKNNKYDSTQDTINHIANVRALLGNVIAECRSILGGNSLSGRYGPRK